MSNTSCLSEFTIIKIASLVGGTVGAATAIGYLGDSLIAPGAMGSFGLRSTYIGSGVLVGGFIGSYAGHLVGPYLPSTMPGAALAAGTGVLLGQLGLPGATITQKALLGVGSAAAYWGGCQLAGMLEGKQHS